MKSLYIYTMDRDGKLNREVWEDVKITRDKGFIVTKRDSEYRLSHGSYKDKDFLNIVRQYSSCSTEYISFEVSEITQEIKEQMIEPFIDEYEEEVKVYQDKIRKLKDVIKES